MGYSEVINTCDTSFVFLNTNIFIAPLQGCYSGVRSAPNHIATEKDSFEVSIKSQSGPWGTSTASKGAHSNLCEGMSLLSCCVSTMDAELSRAERAITWCTQSITA